MAEQDIREDQMTSVDSVDYVRGLKGKDSVLIALSTLLSMTIKNVGNLQDNDLKSVGTCVGYAFGTSDGSGIFGIFISIEVAGYYLQLKAANSGVTLKLRTYDRGNDVWSDWKQISFT